uniref:Uncharacterized protein n=1 Tax=Fagus sylvatica TaxID=28930 RepID=A0A2N9I4Z6_FAGSY
MIPTLPISHSPSKPLALTQHTDTNPTNPETAQAETNNTKLRETLARVRNSAETEADESEMRKKRTRPIEVVVVEEGDGGDEEGFEEEEGGGGGNGVPYQEP